MPAPVATSAAPPRRNAALGFIFVAVLIDVMSLGLIIPVLPKLVEGFTGDTARAAEMLGLFGTAWALMQFVAAPVLGLLSDRYGRRPVLLLSIFGFGFDYVMMALAPSLAWLFVGRVISGITAASFSAAGAYIADVTKPEDRAKSFGLVGAAWGVGFVLGPAIGGLLGEWGPRVPFWAAAAFAFVNGLYGLFVLPESLPPERRSPFRWRRANPLGSLALLRSHPELLGLAAVTFLFQLAHHVLPSIFVLYTSYRYGWGTSELGLMLAATGVANIVVQALLVGPISRAVGDRGALLAGLACGALGFAIYGLAPTALVYWLGLPVFALVGLIQPAVMALMTRRVGAAEQGQLQGASASIIGLTGLIGPGLFTLAFAWSIRGDASQALPGLAVLLAAGLMAAAALLAAAVTAASPARQGEDPG
ncbi:TCR/Tet family MFS transporter [Chelatococcus reniformis]|uniref:Major facilitator superfamily (MFS) profile domain-containing protein n=1 Tax=Chelatococcus reniformis TaxID=1494448 RepID=A0A916X759_9HYPH|nr:TCR/Tet family MFS transporter [Chelatococcus reniformis]GGC50695.1 hypothetical protein GCM10010994_07310 [Chelatococcus reniformis]